MSNDSKIIIPPNSKESEMMVLGCMLTSINALNIAADALDESDFFYKEHRIIFDILKAADNNEKPADIHLVCEELKRQNNLKAVGGAAYITNLAQYAGTSAYIEEYTETLKNLSTLRQLIFVVDEIKKKAFDQEDPVNLITQILEKVRHVEKHRGLNTTHQIKFLNQFEDNFLLVQPPSKPMLLEFIDEKGKTIGFLPKGIVGMLVGAGGIGKTHLLTQLAIAIATGTTFIDKIHPTNYCGDKNRGYVFLGMGENQYDDIHRVLYKSAKILRRVQSELHEEDLLLEASKRIAVFSFCGQQAAFIEDKKTSTYFRDFKNKLIKTAPAEGWSIIILDPISRLIGADAETDNAAATQFISLLEELVIDLPGNPTVLFAHHVNKSALRNSHENKADQTAARGSSAFTDGARWQINFSKYDDPDDDNLTIIKMTKSNFTAFFKDIVLEKELDGYLRAKNDRTIPIENQKKAKKNK